MNGKHDEQLVGALRLSAALAQRAYIINNGHIVHEEPVKNIKADPEILHRRLGV